VIRQEAFHLLTDKAYTLACFLHSERDQAKQLVEQAVTLLPATFQERKPKGRNKTAIRRSCFNESQWLQHLVLYLSEHLEREKERDQLPTQADLIKRYLKLLVQICVPKTVLYVTVGLTRLCFHFSTAESGLLLEQLDGGRIVEDASINRIKGNLQKHLRERFGDLLQESVGPNRERLFESIPNPEPWLHLVTACLEQLTPWDTTCDREKCDLHRSHQIIHLPCLQALCQELSLPNPLSRLRLPQGAEMGKNDMDESPGLEGMVPEERDTLYSRYSWVVQMRQRHVPNDLTIKVDGTPIRQWMTEENQQCELELKETDRMIEIWSTQPPIPLAVFPIGDGDEIMSIRLGKGTVLKLELHADPRTIQMVLKPSLRLKFERLLRTWKYAKAMVTASALTIGLVTSFFLGSFWQSTSLNRGIHLRRSIEIPTIPTWDEQLQQYDRAAAKILFARGEYLFGKYPELAEEALLTLEAAYKPSVSDNDLAEEILKRLIFLAGILGDQEKVDFYQNRLSDLQDLPP